MEDHEKKPGDPGVCPRCGAKLIAFRIEQTTIRETFENPMYGVKGHKTLSEKFDKIPLPRLHVGRRSGESTFRNIGWILTCLNGKANGWRGECEFEMQWNNDEAVDRVSPTEEFFVEHPPPDQMGFFDDGPDHP